ncbi:hypothetical protein [Pediococcus acidilactici]|uniref:hypothetical protein n=2 Tax=Pediococcus acidilactici TaxID=1254 RepID=UPI001F21CB31|nr:hypothetical protein [Pediococcus acidilactici]
MSFRHPTPLLGVNYYELNAILSQTFTGFQEVILMDEIKSTKIATDAMSFKFMDAKAHKLIDILPFRIVQQLESTSNAMSKRPEKISKFNLPTTVVEEPLKRNNFLNTFNLHSLIRFITSIYAC